MEGESVELYDTDIYESRQTYSNYYETRPLPNA